MHSMKHVIRRVHQNLVKPKASTIHIMYHAGMGSDPQSDKDLDIAIRQLVESRRYVSKHTMEVVHNTSNFDVLKTVAATICKMPPSTTSKHVQHVLHMVQTKLATGQVILCGHSYGGAVVATVAQLIDHPHLYCITFGSIYVPKQQRSKTSLKHYMYKNDIAHMCLVSEQMGERLDVMYKDPDSTSQWKSHNSYSELIILAIRELL